MILFRKYNPKYHHRRSIRLKGYDYSQEGLYFITICSHGRDHLFGDIENGKMILNPNGQIASDEWSKTPEIRMEIELGEFVVMPNHIHGIIMINNSLDMLGAYGHMPLPSKQTPDISLRSPSKTVGAIVRGYKSAATKQINVLRNCPKCLVWQRNYYEHIIRDELEYLRISEYIRNNPANWMDDTLNQ